MGGRSCFITSGAFGDTLWRPSAYLNPTYGRPLRIVAPIFLFPRRQKRADSFFFATVPAVVDAAQGAF